jgi:hypothetical protein
MRKLFAALIALVLSIAGLAAALAGGQSCCSLGVWSTPLSGGSYTGPGDVVSGASAFWSCRAYSAAKAGTKAYRIVCASDSTQTDISSLANGPCDTTTPATFSSPGEYEFMPNPPVLVPLKYSCPIRHPLEGHGFVGPVYVGPV